ncbi:hypothetical protein ABLC79_24255, partial [Escherichia coli]|uniref:hypothetical protein n=1 Tax=Escherichia coli TaxID=562 RepID=UPI0036E82DA5
RLRFSGPKTSIICSPMTSLKTSIKTITYLSDIGCLEIQGASLDTFCVVLSDVMCAGRGADIKKARRSEPVFNECKIQLFLSNT